MLLCLDRIGINIILPILSCKKNHKEATKYGEYIITPKILNNGYAVKALYNLSFDKYDPYTKRYETIFYKTRSKYLIKKNKK